jgi:cyclopropane fatty-acyl-phospholipid synthase-like methyltransferase
MSPKAARSATRKTATKTRESMAARADRHVLYEAAVQCAEAEIDFVDETYQTLRGRKAQWLREDFCGTANTAAEWVRRRRRNHAIGVDLDREVQAWGEAHHLTRLGSARNRIELLTANVLDVECRPVDIVLAMNFSYWIFKERRLLRRYFAHVCSGLGEGGLFMLDAYGGADAHRELEERTKLDTFTYVWDQERVDPITGDILCHIHFGFPDRSRIRKAFTYDWRLWSLPEIREVLIEAGFLKATVYWEGTDPKTEEGNGVFTPAGHGEADAAYIAYIVAEK